MSWNKSIIRLGLAFAVTGCAPNTSFKSSLDVSGDVKTRPAGFTGGPGRINLDCYTEKVNGNDFNRGERPQSIGIPMNCPTSGQSANSTVTKFDVAVVLDVSENMISLSSNLKQQIVQLLTKLNSDGRIGSLSAISFRSKIVGSVANGEISKLISDIGGSAAEWNPNALKSIDPNSTDWVANDAAKAVFGGIEEGLKHLQSGSNASKMLILVSASTGTGSAGTEVGPIAKLISEYNSKMNSGAGQFIFNYAANNELARGLSSYDPTAIEQLDLLASTAGIKPVRVAIPGDLSNWAQVTTTRASTVASSAEACPLSGFEATNESGQTIFKKDVPVADMNGTFEASLPAAVPNGNLVLKISRKCARSGAKTQSVAISLTKGGASK